ncbi:hypothetical protein IH980_00150 [Patescibacteria group bacterium]|nr:hypothetical protein [Patescibacteria group bacterium]
MTDAKNLTSHLQPQNFCQIIGAGAVEPRPGWHHSGLLLVVDGRPYLIDVTPQNWSDFGDWLFHKDAVFVVTHGHMDHFDPMHPWTGVFDSRFANFGSGQEDTYPVHLFGPQGVVDLLLTTNGFDPTGSKGAGGNTNHTRVTDIYHRLQRITDGRTLHVHTLVLNTPEEIDGLKFVPFDAVHKWSYQQRSPRHFEGKHTCYGYIIDSRKKRYLYMPDFEIGKGGKLERNIALAAKDSSPLDYFIVGCPNPHNRDTSTPHSAPKDIYRLYTNLKKRQVLTDQTMVVFTHLNPNWQHFAFENPGFPEDKLMLAENGKMVYAGELALFKEQPKQAKETDGSHPVHPFL